LALDTTWVCGSEIQSRRGKDVTGTWLLHTLHGNGDCRWWHVISVSIAGVLVAGTYGYEYEYEYEYEKEAWMLGVGGRKWRPQDDQPAESDDF
jgi:hypothetical protein